ncbi:MAG: deoxynucleoside kinase [Clostridia bacterium]|nr:deoxynucleoside kinase [Clostridia bacterium]
MGYIVVITGTDGCGKQTQTKCLMDRLAIEGIDAMAGTFPKYDSPSSAPVKMYLGGEFGDANSLDAYQASTLYAVDRLCTYNKDMKEYYENGGIIVLDRYVESNMLHQAGKIRDRAEVDKYLEWLEDFEYGKLKLPKPDKVIFLDVPIEVSLKLKENRAYKAETKKDVQEDDVEHLINAYNSGKYVSEKYGWTTISCVEDGQLLSIETIAEKVWNSVKEDLKN